MKKGKNKVEQEAVKKEERKKKTTHKEKKKKKKKDQRLTKRKIICNITSRNKLCIKGKTCTTFLIYIIMLYSYNIKVKIIQT